MSIKKDELNETTNRLKYLLKQEQPDNFVKRVSLITFNFQYDTLYEV